MQDNTKPDSMSAKYSCDECKTFLEILQIVLDNEADDEQVAFVNEHIGNCGYCFECYEVDKTLRQTIRQKIQRISTPQELTLLIQSKISAFIE
jgi:predicted anti-sigma-YlaC factor YlaD